MQVVHVSIVSLQVAHFELQVWHYPEIGVSFVFKQVELQVLSILNTFPALHVVQVVIDEAHVRQLVLQGIHKSLPSPFIS